LKGPKRGPFFVVHAALGVISIPMKILRTSPAAIRTTLGAGLLALALWRVTGTAFAACEFRAGSTTGSIAFPVLDPVTAPNVTAAFQLDVRCTPASGFTVAQWTWTSANGGASIGRMAGGTPIYSPGIPYSVGIAVVNQGSNGTLTVTLQIAGPDYANVNAGSYVDVLTLTVTP
jgi:multisubunit Na+/H+ antiporter MnhG subunit